MTKIIGYRLTDGQLWMPGCTLVLSFEPVSRARALRTLEDPLVGDPNDLHSDPEAARAIVPSIGPDQVILPGSFLAAMLNREVSRHLGRVILREMHCKFRNAILSDERFQTQCHLTGFRPTPRVTRLGVDFQGQVRRGGRLWLAYEGSCEIYAPTA